MSARRRKFRQDEDATILDLSRTGRTAREAAERLGQGRTRCGCIARAIRLGVPFDPDPDHVAAISAAALAAYWAANPVRLRVQP